MISKPQKAILHVAKAKLGRDDELYRQVLVRIAGVTSSTELDQSGFTAMMGFFEYMGFTPLTSNGADYGRRSGMATFAQLELIRTIWRELTRNAYSDERELNKWLFRTFKVSSLRFMTKAQGQKAIAALKAMKARAA